MKLLQSFITHYHCSDTSLLVYEHISQMETGMKWIKTYFFYLMLMCYYHDYLTLCSVYPGIIT